jgi:2-keto-3-deoxy-L-fuconate dehydrogenase
MECDNSAWDFSFDINVKSMHRMLRAFIPGMLARGSGSIVNIASGAGSVRGIPNRYVYGATKAAVIGLTKAVAATPWLSRGTVSEPLQAVAFLIEAVKQTPAPVAAKALAQPRPFVNVGPQFVRVLDIFERLERAEQMSKSR